MILLSRCGWGVKWSNGPNRRSPASNMVPIAAWAVSRSSQERPPR
jgi:hypothetical protein